MSSHNQGLFKNNTMGFYLTSSLLNNNFYKFFNLHVESIYM